MKGSIYRIDRYKCDICGAEYDVVYKNIEALGWRGVFQWSNSICPKCGMYGMESLMIRRGQERNVERCAVIWDEVMI